MARLHGLYATAMPDGPCDVFAAESWTLSQAYYYGRVARSPHHRVESVDGEFIDQLHGLDATARGRPAGANKTGSIEGSAEAREDAELIRAVVAGEDFHVALTALAGRYVAAASTRAPLANSYVASCSRSRIQRVMHDGMTDISISYSRLRFRRTQVHFRSRTAAVKSQRLHGE